MNHRRHKAMRFVKLSWITRSPKTLVFYLINTSLPKSGFLACISSRITTVIQVVRYYQINDNWFNEPFAVSLYSLLILRHAWLNLWDKHMTTGRINQVTIFFPPLPANSRSDWSVTAWNPNLKFGNNTCESTLLQHCREAKSRDASNCRIWIPSTVGLIEHFNQIDFNSQINKALKRTVSEEEATSQSRPYEWTDTETGLPPICWSRWVNDQWPKIHRLQQCSCKGQETVWSKWDRTLQKSFTMDTPQLF